MQTNVIYNTDTTNNPSFDRHKVLFLNMQHVPQWTLCMSTDELYWLCNNNSDNSNSI
jgi:hypothetical protein